MSDSNSDFRSGSVHNSIEQTNEFYSIDDGSPISQEEHTLYTLNFEEQTPNTLIDCDGSTINFIFGLVGSLKKRRAHIIDFEL